MKCTYESVIKLRNGASPLGRHGNARLQLGVELGSFCPAHTVAIQDNLLDDLILLQAVSQRLAANITDAVTRQVHRSDRLVGFNRISNQLGINIIKAIIGQGQVLQSLAIHKSTTGLGAHWDLVELEGRQFVARNQHHLDNVIESHTFIECNVCEGDLLHGRMSTNGTTEEKLLIFIASDLDVGEDQFLDAFGLDKFGKLLERDLGVGLLDDGRHVVAMEGEVNVRYFQFGAYPENETSGERKQLPQRGWVIGRNDRLFAFDA